MAEGGHPDMLSYLVLLDKMDPENMKDFERRFMAEAKELRQISADVDAMRLMMEN